MILAKKFKRLVRRRKPLVSKGVDSLLPCRHAVSIIPVVMSAGVYPPGAPTGASSNSEDPVAFKPNYGRDRAERARHVLGAMRKAR